MSNVPTHCAECGEKLREPWDPPGATHCDVCRDDAPPERRTFPPDDGDERHDPIACECDECQERAENSRVISRAADRDRSRFLGVQRSAGRFARRRWYEPLGAQGKLADSLRVDEDAAGWQHASIIDLDAEKGGHR